MGLAEGAIRKNGLPAKKAAPLGFPRAGELRAVCKRKGCTKPPPLRRGPNGPHPQYCSSRCRALANPETHRYRSGSITLAQYNTILTRQGGRCPICGTSDPGRAGMRGSEGRFHLDHDHDHCEFGCIECVRGLLCQRCNRGLGQFIDDPARLRAAADYLERFMKERDARSLFG